MRHTLQVAVLALFVTVIAGCASFPWRGETPRVSIAGLSFLDANLFEQRYRLTLRIQNPNAFDLRINGIAFDLDVNDRPFADPINSCFAFGGDWVWSYSSGGGIRDCPRLFKPQSRSA